MQESKKGLYTCQTHPSRSKEKKNRNANVRYALSAGKEEKKNAIVSKTDRQLI
jgi:hypothetical protein